MWSWLALLHFLFISTTVKFEKKIMSTLTELSSKPIAGGVQKHFSHKSNATNCVMKFMIFFPFEEEQNSDVDSNNNSKLKVNWKKFINFRHFSDIATINPSDKYPVLYYLVGYQNDETTLSQLAYHRHAKQHNLIVVCPDASPRNTGTIYFCQQTGNF